MGKNASGRKEEEAVRGVLSGIISKQVKQATTRCKDEPKRSRSPSYSWIQSLSHEDAHIEIDTRCRNDTAYGSRWQTAYILLCRAVVGNTIS